MLLKRKRKQSNKNLRLSKNNKGVTLVEMIAVIAVLSVVIAAVTGFMITGTQMSAKVSGTATESLKTQTAVDFINQRFWEATRVSVDAASDKVEIDSKEYFKRLTIEGAELKTYYTGENSTAYVGYKFGDESEEPIYLCPGEIYFEFRGDGNTVAYSIDGVWHVVRLRVAKVEYEMPHP